MRRSYGARQDPDGTQHARVSDAIRYSVVTILWRRKVGNGTIRCELLRGDRPARRLVQLTADYTDADGTDVTHVVRCDSELDEQYEAARLERVILKASSAPTPSSAR